MRKVIYSVVAAAICLGGCSEQSEITIQPEKNIVTEMRKTQAIVPKIEVEPTDYRLYMYETDYQLGLYEPQQGCYAGAYVLSNRSLQFDIKQFEEMTQKSHGIYIYNMKLGEVFPLQWVLECISQKKTPHIIVHPPSTDMPYQEFLLERAAREFGQFYVPIFVQFYPNPHQSFKNPEDYKSFFQKARETFRKYASNAAFVWSVDSDSVYDNKVYYPGDEAVDWVGLNIYEPIYINGLKNEQDVRKPIDFFYHQYQRRKPIMISQLGISHYSKKDHGYYIEEAAEKLNEIYEKLRTDYPRIKAVHYMDFNNIAVAPGEMGSDNFSITEDATLLSTYRSQIGDEHFLDILEVRESGSPNEERFISAFPVYSSSYTFYIDEKVLTYEWGVGAPEKVIESLTADSGIYYPLEETAEYYGYIVEIDESNQRILLKK